VNRRWPETRGQARAAQLWTAPDWPLGAAPDGGIAVERFHFVSGTALYGMVGGVPAPEPSVAIAPEADGIPFDGSWAWDRPEVTLGLPAWAQEAVLDELTELGAAFQITIGATDAIFTSELSLRYSVRRLVALSRPGVDLVSADLWRMAAT